MTVHGRLKELAPHIRESKAVAYEGFGGRVWSVLINHFPCSWREAGDWIADAIGEGSYIDWYMSASDYHSECGEVCDLFRNCEDFK